MQVLVEKERPRIEYWQFQKLILDFQLRSHEKYLKRFIQLFRTVDQDHNGIINEVPPKISTLKSPSSDS